MAQTLEEIAKLAGVSRSTVSRVINDHPNVRDEVRERVWRVVRAQNYQPHQAARTLVTRRTNVIGLIIPETVTRLFADSFFNLFIQGVAEVCNRRGYYLMLSLMLASTNRDALYRRILHSGQLDGVIVSSASLDDPIIPRLEENHYPCVLVGRHPDYPQIPWVDVDNVTGARGLIEYLIELGHRRIATITGPMRAIAGRERFEGYRQALDQARIAFDDKLVVEGDFTEESGAQGMERLLRSRPTAVFAASDAMAAGAMQSLNQAGLRVPEDVSVAGYDDAPIAAMTDPPLTTVRQSAVELGKVATETLISLLEKPDVPVPSQKLSTSLVVRDSTRQL